MSHFEIKHEPKTLKIEDIPVGSRLRQEMEHQQEFFIEHLGDFALPDHPDDPNWVISIYQMNRGRVAVFKSGVMTCFERYDRGAFQEILTSYKFIDNLRPMIQHMPKRPLSLRCHSEPNCDSMDVSLFEEDIATPTNRLLIMSCLMRDVRELRGMDANPAAPISKVMSNRAFLAQCIAWLNIYRGGE